jgi:hypothetical protein
MSTTDINELSRQKLIEMVEDPSPLELNSLLEIMKKTPQPFKSILFFQRIEMEVQKSSR